MKKRTYILSLTAVFAAACVLPNVAWAQVTPTPLDALFAAAEEVNARLTPIAAEIYSTLFVLELIVSVLWWWVQDLEGGTLAFRAFLKIMFMAVLGLLITGYALWFPPIIEGFVSAGVAATGGSAASYSPGEIYALGNQFYTAALSKVPDGGIIPGIFTNAGVTFLAIGAVLALAFILIALQLAVFTAEAYIAVNAGMILMGFGVFRGTASLADAFIGYVFNLGIRLFLLYLIVGLLQPLAFDWIAYVAAQPGMESMEAFFEVLGMAVIYAGIALYLPVTMASYVTRSFDIGIASALSKI